MQVDFIILRMEYAIVGISGERIINFYFFQKMVNEGYG